MFNTYTSFVVRRVRMCRYPLDCPSLPLKHRCYSTVCVLRNYMLWWEGGFATNPQIHKKQNRRYRHCRYVSVKSVPIFNILQTFVHSNNTVTLIICSLFLAVFSLRQPQNKIKMDLYVCFTNIVQWGHEVTRNDRRRSFSSLVRSPGPTTTILPPTPSPYWVAVCPRRRVFTSL